MKLILRKLMDLDIYWFFRVLFLSILWFYIELIEIIEEFFFILNKNRFFKLWGKL